MRYLFYSLGFSLLVITAQAPQLLAVQRVSSSSLATTYLAAQNHNCEDGYLSEGCSPPRGSDRR